MAHKITTENTLSLSRRQPHTGPAGLACRAIADELDAVSTISNRTNVAFKQMEIQVALNLCPLDRRDV